MDNAVTPQANLGQTIRECRRALDFTQAELARRVGVHRSTASEWERGKSRPSRHLPRIADVLGCSVDQLLCNPLPATFGHVEQAPRVFTPMPCDPVVTAAILTSIGPDYRNHKRDLNCIEKSLYENALKAAAWFTMTEPAKALNAVEEYERELTDQRARAEAARLARTNPKSAIANPQSGEEAAHGSAVA